MIHVAEMETIFAAAFNEAIRQNVTLDEHFDLSIIGAVLSNDTYSGNKSAIFVDSSSVLGQISSTQKRSCNDAIVVTTSRPNILDCSILTLSSTSDDKQGATFHHLFTQTRSLMSSPRSLHRCHPSIIPNYIFLVNCFPQNGAAGKIDRLALISLAKSELQKNRVDNNNKVKVDKRTDPEESKLQVHFCYESINPYNNISIMFMYDFPQPFLSKIS